ncbi:hypothetical protein [Mesorhizobium sp.]|uniref:hypothetical protein n=1 Tax=Mesorhizobium sp. TaxID=1871066 RepID=UPI00257B7CE7|nr:hypothetical protein [Mesorhizobium sp.]
MTAFHRPEITFSARSAGSSGSLFVGSLLVGPLLVGPVLVGPVLVGIAMVTSWSAGDK